jgi:capsular exopolysaccharide synthesis family protein
MSKLYDAIMKARKEEEALKKVRIPQPKPQPVEPRQEADRKAPLLDVRPKIMPKESTKKPLVARERITCVSIGNFIAKPGSLMEEQFRKLRAAITNSNLDQSLQTVLVTSCMPGEGKTKVAMNLSAAIAKGLDDSAILIDADFRKKSLSSLLGLRNSSGLSDILKGSESIQNILVNTEIKGLAILPAGSNRQNPAELIASIRMRNLVETLRERYNGSYIVIDSTPIVSASEASILSQMVDGVVVVILAEKTRRDVVKRELDAINREKILGVVLNCAEFETSGYYKKYYKHYYGKKKDS